MAALGTYTFDERHTSVTDTVDEVAGRTRRIFVVSGLIVDKTTETDIVAELDAIADAVSEGRWVSFSVRPGRDFTVERIEMSRRVDTRELIGAFTLRLGARDPFERDTTDTHISWPVSSSGSAKTFTSGGNVFSEPTIAIESSGDVINPSITDGSRTFKYWGTVADGETLLFDAAARTVTLDGKDVMPYTTGEFPRVSPEGTTLTYTDAASSSHTASVTVSWKNRWW